MAFDHKTVEPLRFSPKTVRPNGLLVSKNNLINNVNLIGVAFYTISFMPC